MSSGSTAITSLGLPWLIERGLADFLNAARDAFGSHLTSAVLYGSGADGTLRPTSDVNLLLILSSFEQAEADRLSPAMILARASIRLRVMFLIEGEVAAAVESFAQKFADVIRRRRVLLGKDPFAGVPVPRSAELFRVRQVLLNLTLRLRESYVREAGFEDRLVILIAETAGPLRSSAAAILELEGSPAGSSKTALEQVAQSAGTPASALSAISQARETRTVTENSARQTIFELLRLAEKMRERALAIS